jgi:hypothetical protein
LQLGKYPNIVNSGLSRFVRDPNKELRGISLSDFVDVSLHIRFKGSPLLEGSKEWSEAIKNDIDPAFDFESESELLPDSWFDKKTG